MPREKEFEPREALEKAMQLFWQKGYFDTSMDDLVACTGVSRYGLYGTFGGKRELFLKALELYREAIIGQLIAAVEVPDASLAEIRAYFTNMLAFSTATPQKRNMGCMVCNTAVDLAPFDVDAALQVRTTLERMMNAFRHALTNARTQGELPQQFDVDAYADYLTGASQGLSVLLRSSLDLKNIQRYVQTLLSTLN